MEWIGAMHIALQLRVLPVLQDHTDKNRRRSQRCRSKNLLSNLHWWHQVDKILEKILTDQVLRGKNWTRCSCYHSGHKQHYNSSVSKNKQKIRYPSCTFRSLQIVKPRISNGFRDKSGGKNRQLFNREIQYGKYLPNYRCFQGLSLTNCDKILENKKCFSYAELRIWEEFLIFFRERCHFSAKNFGCRKLTIMYT